jgi:hypothetical protein
MSRPQILKTATAAPTSETEVLRFEYALHAGAVDVRSSLIYKWLIRDKQGNLLGIYVGKAKSGERRPTSHHGRNVSNLMNGKPYRRGKESGFRKIHVALAEAAKLGHHVELHFVCNVDPTEDINHIEREWIQRLNCRGSESWQLNG